MVTLYSSFQLSDFNTLSSTLSSNTDFKYHDFIHIHFNTFTSTDSDDDSDAAPEVKDPTSEAIDTGKWKCIYRANEAETPKFQGVDLNVGGTGMKAPLAWKRKYAPKRQKNYIPGYLRVRKEKEKRAAEEEKVSKLGITLLLCQLKKSINANSKFVRSRFAGLSQSLSSYLICHLK